MGQVIQVKKKLIEGVQDNVVRANLREEKTEKANWVNVVEKIGSWLTSGQHDTINPERRMQTDDGKD